MKWAILSKPSSIMYWEIKKKIQKRIQKNRRYIDEKLCRESSRKREPAAFFGGQDSSL